MDGIGENKKEATDELMGSAGGIPQASQATQADWKKEHDKHQAAIDVVMKTASALNKEIENINDNIKVQKKSIEDINTEVEKIKQVVRNAELRSIEVIGIISAVIALVLVYVNQANAQKSLKESYAILITGTAGLVIFTSLIHHFFNKDDIKNFWYYFFFLIIPLLALIATGYFIFK